MSATGAGAPKVVGVCGAGTMGAGIAQLACQAGACTLLHDPEPKALERGIAAIETQLARGVERERWSDADARAARERLEPATSIEALAPCELVIEAAPESLAVKHELFGALSAIVGPDCVLATNTSSLLVTAIAAAATNPERVVGMHFFNPAPVMRLLEVVAGEASSDRAIAIARAAGEAMDKRVIVAADGPGFLVNRCGRPFGLEALRLLQERLAPLEQVDRICRMGGGFRMGPFELMDLVGVDVGFEVSKSFYEQSFGEPRWRPSPITARMVAAGRHGRKTGRGYYQYGDGPHRPDDPESPAAQHGEESLVVTGNGVLASDLREAADTAGYRVSDAIATDQEAPWLIIDCRLGDELELGTGEALQGAPQAILCAAGSLAELDPAGGAVGFHALPPFDHTWLVELARTETTAATAAERAERFFAVLGKRTEWVGDAPGLVLGRIVCQLVNEAAFALGEGVGSPEDIDAGMLLGLNYPHGPLHWADAIGLDHVLAVLEGLADEYGEPRYRSAPVLRHRVLAGRLGNTTGAGFFEHGK